MKISATTWAQSAALFAILTVAVGHSASTGYAVTPDTPVPFDVVAAQVKEARVETIFRYAHVYPRALALMGSRKIDVRPLVTDTYAFADSIAAFDYAVHMRPARVKVQIELP